jgi:hypothetical protein
MMSFNAIKEIFLYFWSSWDFHIYDMEPNNMLIYLVIFNMSLGFALALPQLQGLAATEAIACEELKAEGYS